MSKKRYLIKCYYSGYAEYEVEAEDEDEAIEIGCDNCHYDYPDISGVDEYEVEELEDEEDE